MSRHEWERFRMSWNKWEREWTRAGKSGQKHTRARERMEENGQEHREQARAGESKGEQTIHCCLYEVAHAGASFGYGRKFSFTFGQSRACAPKSHFFC